MPVKMPPVPQMSPKEWVLGGGLLLLGIVLAVSFVAALLGLAVLIFRRLAGF